MSSFYFYTETAFHHQGDMEYLKKLIIATKETGANGIKFQVMTRTEDFISTKNTAFKDLATWSFNYDEWVQIFEFTLQQQLDIIMMPLNTAALPLATQFPIKFLEIHSVSFNDYQLHEKIKESGIDLIIGVGGRTLEEIESMKTYFGSQLKVLMTGFQSFPSKLQDIKLGKISAFKERFTSMTIGYADHSAYDNEFAILSNEYAYLLGARIFEKHITVDEGIERVDYSAALAPEKIKASIERLQFVENFVLVPDSQHLEFNEAELKYRNRQLICVANGNIGKGKPIAENDIALKLINCTDKVFNKKQDVVGKTALLDIAADDPILYNNII